MYKLLLLICLILPSSLYGQTELMLMTTTNNDGYGLTYEINHRINDYYSIGGSVENQFNSRVINVLNNVLLYRGSFELCSDIEFGFFNENTSNHSFITTIGIGYNKSITNLSYTIEPRLIYNSQLKWDVLIGLYYEMLVVEFNTDMHDYELMIGVLININ